MTGRSRKHPRYVGAAAERRKPRTARPPNPAAERGAMAMTVRNSMAHGYRIEARKNNNEVIVGTVHALSNDYKTRRGEEDPARSNLLVRFTDGRKVPLEDLASVRRAGD